MDPTAFPDEKLKSWRFHKCLDSTRKEVVMRVTSLKVFVRVLLFGLVLGASSTAYADVVAITSFSLSNPQFNPATGTAVFTPTGVSARANASNSLGQSQNNLTNTFPFAQTSAAVPFASAFA